MEDNWAERVAIGSAEFQQGCERRRWVSRVHSFDPSTGRAFIQVGECWPGIAPTVEYAVYSWREWDLTHNQEVRLIRVCGSPFEPFDDSAQ
jgi:hypothetical protein